MTHSFDIDIAKEYGILEAIILNNMGFWIARNRANGKNFFDGEFWTYNSAAAFSEVFPYATKRQIEIALKNLRDNDILKTGNYNKDKRDRTLWYTLTTKGKRILHFGDMQYTSTSQSCHENATPLPDVNLSLNTDVFPHNPPNVDANKPKNKSRAEKKQDVEDVIHAYTQDEEVLDRLDAWLEVRKEKRSPNTVRAVKLNLKKLDNYARLSKMSVPQYLDEIVARGWAAFYVINSFSTNNKTYKNNTNCNNSQKINDAPVTEHDIYGD